MILVAPRVRSLLMSVRPFTETKFLPPYEIIIDCEVRTAYIMSPSRMSVIFPRPLKIKMVTNGRVVGITAGGSGKPKLLVSDSSTSSISLPSNLQCSPVHHTPCVHKLRVLALHLLRALCMAMVNTMYVFFVFHPFSTADLFPP